MKALAGQPLPWASLTTGAAWRSIRLLIALFAVTGDSLPAQFFDRSMVTDGAISPDGQQVAFTLRAPAESRDSFVHRVYHMAADGGTPTLLGTGDHPAFAPVGGAIARLTWHEGRRQLVVRDALDAEDRVVSAAHQQVSTFRWSPDATRLVFSAEEVAPIGNGAVFSGGDRGARHALYVVDAAGGVPRRITPEGFALGPAEPELEGLIEFDWIGADELIVSGRAAGNTEGPHATSLHIAEVGTGNLRYLVGAGGRWHLPVVSPNGDWIAFTGQALGPAGWMASELIVIRPNGSGLRRLTIGRDRDALDIAWAPDSRTVWFATEDRGSRNLLRVDSRNNRIGTGTSGVHVLMLAAIAARGDWALAIRSTTTTPGDLIRFPLAKPHELTVLHASGEVEGAGEIEELDLAVAGSQNLHGWLVRPPAFDASQRHPLLLEIHGGPHAMASAGYAPSMLAHAAAGWLVVRLNPRGSTGLGFDLANGLGSQWPARDVDDLRAAITALVNDGLVDSTRIAVAGNGAGAAVAMALRAADPRIVAAILRCADGDWLAGGGGVDAAPWHEWHAARPFAQSAAAWWRAFAPTLAVPVRSPLLVIEGAAVAPQAISIADAMHAQAAQDGAIAKFVRLEGSCRDAGPATQQQLFEVERGFLGS